jgi:hypothetical protein
MSRLSLTLACGPYDRMEALAQGIVQPEGINLRYLAIQSPPEIFARMIKSYSFDAAEMSLAHYCIMRVQLVVTRSSKPSFRGISLATRFRNGEVIRRGHGDRSDSPCAIYRRADRS